MEYRRVCWTLCIFAVIQGENLYGMGNKFLPLGETRTVSWTRWLCQHAGEWHVRGMPSEQAWRPYHKAKSSFRGMGSRRTGPSAVPGPAWVSHCTLQLSASQDGGSSNSTAGKEGYVQMCSPFSGLILWLKGPGDCWNHWGVLQNWGQNSIPGTGARAADL